MKAALLDRNGTVIGEVINAPEKGNLIPVAGDFTASGDPVNVSKLPISRSKKNLAKAVFEDPVCKIGSVWFFAMQAGQ